jgi:uncharacterized membrane protein YgcG
MRLLGSLVLSAGLAFSAESVWTTREKARVSLTDFQERHELLQAERVKLDNDRQFRQLEITDLERDLRSDRALLAKWEDELRGFQHDLQSLPRTQNDEAANQYRSKLIAVITRENDGIASLRGLISQRENVITSLKRVIADIDQQSAINRLFLMKSEVVLAQGHLLLADCDDLLRREMSLPRASGPQFQMMLGIVDRSEMPPKEKTVLVDAMREGLKDKVDRVIDRYIPGGDNRPAKAFAHAVIDMSPAKVMASSFSSSEISPDQGKPPNVAARAIIRADHANDPLGGTTPSHVTGGWTGPDPHRSADRLYAGGNLPSQNTVQDIGAHGVAYANSSTKGSGGGTGGGGGSAGGGGGGNSSGGGGARGGPDPKH